MRPPVHGGPPLQQVRPPLLLLLLAAGVSAVQEESGETTARANETAAASAQKPSGRGDKGTRRTRARQEEEQKKEKFMAFQDADSSDDVDQNPKVKMGMKLLKNMVPMSTCFSGAATADVEGRGPTPLRELRAGDRVLVDRTGGGELAYEAMPAFLHAFEGSRGAPAEYLEVAYEGGGCLRVSGNHFVYVYAAGQRATKYAARLTTQDALLVVDGDRVVPRSVVGVRRKATTAGMYAPFTASGNIVVDGALSSVFATSSVLPRVPSTAMFRAVHFPLRVYHALRRTLLGTSVPAREEVPRRELHFFTEALLALRLERLLK